MNYRRSLVLLCLVGLMMAGTGRAATLYLAPPNQSGGSDLNAFLEADDFTLGSTAQITQIRFWAFQSSVADYAGSIAWSFNADASGVPGASLASGLATPSPVSTGNSAFGLNEFSYTFAVNVTLGPGTDWLVLHNGPTNTIPGTDFFWEWSDGNSGNSQSQDLAVAGQPWIGNFSEFALELQSPGSRTDVPEPSSLLLLGAGFLGVLLVRHRQHN